LRAGSGHRASAGGTSAAADGAVPAFVFRLVPSAFHHGALGVVRSLGRLGAPVHANLESRWDPLRSSRFAADGVVWSPWPRSPEEAIERLLAWAGRRSAAPLLIPVDDAAALAVADHAEALAERFLLPRADAALARRLSDKLALARLCEELDVPSPRTVAPRTRDEADAVAAQLTFPVVVKRIANRSQADYDEPSVRIVADAAELQRVWRRLAARGAAENYLLQEFIPGGPETIWMFNGYFDDSSRCLVSYTGFKIRQYPPAQGPTTLGECRRNDTVSELAVRLLSRVGYRGIVDLGFRYDARDGRYKLLDVNPRIGATFRLFVASSGTDVARALYLDLTGRPVPGDGAPDGRRWLVEPLDLRVCARTRSFGAWFRSLATVQERAWLAADDPRPAGVLVARLAGLAAARLRDRTGTSEAAVA
jgi:predicted ATP-grasp superfamily ATP-dependent carboligase